MVTWQTASSWAGETQEEGKHLCPWVAAARRWLWGLLGWLDSTVEGNQRLGWRHQTTERCRLCRSEPVKAGHRVVRGRLKCKGSYTAKLAHLPRAGAGAGLDAPYRQVQRWGMGLDLPYHLITPHSNELSRGHVQLWELTTVSQMG